MTEPVPEQALVSLPSSDKPERVYYTSKSDLQLYQAIIERPDVLESIDGRSVDPKALMGQVSYVAERLEHGFRLHCAAVGQESSTTGLRPTLHLEARFEPGAKGTQVALAFRYARTGWALQRVAGLALSTVLGAIWILLGSGALMDRVIFYGIFLLFVSPVVWRDLRSSSRRKQEQLALLNVVEGTYGGWALPEPSSERSPYRLSGGSGSDPAG